MDERFQQICAWLERLPFLAGHEYSQPVAASSDASFRRYFRIRLARPFIEQSSDALGYHNDSLIIMDAPPQHEDCRPFIGVACTLAELGLNVPKILAQDLSQGFLLLSDLGTETYLSQLIPQQESRAESLYGGALSALVKLQRAGGPASQQLPAYDAALLHREMDLFSDWLGEKHLQIGLNKLQKGQWTEIKQVLIESALAQPQTFVHRDYHSRNLMLAPGLNPGVIDFQDAVRGGLTYDAVSLLRDCYIAWPPEQVQEWLRAYFLQLCAAQVVDTSQWSDFVKAFDLMGIQRHLKASGIFARLSHRDGKDGYLNDIPQTLNYIVQVGAKYPQMKPLLDWIEKDWLVRLHALPAASQP
ncbi:aminoglycoside phosphotransferase [Thiosulfatimonas sediminis]|uniref:Aminoglycoside phosphotransferase n=1 Tax=Thiosulfatimonas sediminis TaxID=2675054 RepID=A0A6F8PTD6_9GAMM|nr:phosphotransferase [Thiosulfatimonas sediminis]BBP45369.1 aminoglycoside phosphotransferase [Thiosulfatimonas sediminis]